MHPASVAEAVTYTSAIALAAGAVLVLAGVLRVGWVAEFLSKPIVTGFVFGLTILVIIGELPNLLGIPVTPGDVLHRIYLLALNIDQIKPLTAAVGVSALAVLFIGSRLLPRVPWALLVLVLGLAAAYWLDLAARGVAVVGSVPKGLPTPTIPVVPLNRLVDVALAGAAIAVVGLAEGLSAGRLYATKGGYRLDTDQELIAAGGANLGSGLFGGLGVAGSLSKTAAVDRARGRSQVSGLSAAAIAILAILLPPSILPKAVLSAIVINAVWGLLDLSAIRRYMKVRKNDGIAALVAAGGVLIAGPMLGLLIAIGQSLLGMVYRSSRVDVEILGKIPGEKAAWGGVRNHPDRTTIPGILVAAGQRVAVLGQRHRGPGGDPPGGRCGTGYQGADPEPGVDRPARNDQRRHIVRAARAACRPQRRPVPRAGTLAGPDSPRACRASRTIRRGPPMAQRRPGDTGGPPAARD